MIQYQEIHGALLQPIPGHAKADPWDRDSVANYGRRLVQRGGRPTPHRSRELGELIDDEASGRSTDESVAHDAGTAECNCIRSDRN